VVLLFEAAATGGSPFNPIRLRVFPFIFLWKDQSQTKLKKF